MKTIAELAAALQQHGAEITRVRYMSGFWNVVVECKPLLELPISTLTEDLELSIRTAVRLVGRALEQRAALIPVEERS